MNCELYEGRTATRVHKIPDSVRYYRASCEIFFSGSRMMEYYFSWDGEFSNADVIQLICEEEGMLVGVRQVVEVSVKEYNKVMDTLFESVYLIKKEKKVMEKLSTIQKRENLNEVFVTDEKGNGGANHEYAIKGIEIGNTGKYQIVEHIHFQNGARKLKGSEHGVLDTDLLEIVRHRLQCFQKGDFATEANGHALKHIEEALMWMNRRVEDRIERNVLGTDEK